jgi:hypothetical protein
VGEARSQHCLERGRTELLRLPARSAASENKQVVRESQARNTSAAWQITICAINILGSEECHRRFSPPIPCPGSSGRFHDAPKPACLACHSRPDRSARNHSPCARSTLPSGFRSCRHQTAQPLGRLRRIQFSARKNHYFKYRVEGACDECIRRR